MSRRAAVINEMIEQRMCTTQGRALRVLHPASGRFRFIDDVDDVLRTRGCSYEQLIGDLMNDLAAEVLQRTLKPFLVESNANHQEPARPR